MKRHIFTLFCISLCLCFSTLSFAEVVHINSGEAIQYLNKPLPKMVILDVRTTQEYTVGHIPGAILADFYANDFEAQLGKIERNVPILLYCRTGNRTHKSLELMIKMGFSNILHMKDGITGWNTNEFPLAYGPPNK